MKLCCDSSLNDLSRSTPFEVTISGLMVGSFGESACGEPVGLVFPATVGTGEAKPEVIICDLGEGVSKAGESFCFVEFVFPARRRRG
jgi:hypothetical protein